MSFATFLFLGTQCNVLTVLLIYLVVSK